MLFSSGCVLAPVVHLILVCFPMPKTNTSQPFVCCRHAEMLFPSQCRINQTCQYVRQTLLASLSFSCSGSPLWLPVYNVVFLWLYVGPCCTFHPCLLSYAQDKYLPTPLLVCVVIMQRCYVQVVAA